VNRRASGSVALAVMAWACAVACGVPAEDAPRPVEVLASERPVPAPTAQGMATVDVYFVQGTRLGRVSRRAPERSASAALASLVAGPSRAEVLSEGFRTALAPQPFTYLGTERIGSREVARVDADEEFASVTGGNQLLAVAQVVWTLTALPGVEQVLIKVDGARIEVPTDDGLSDQPVGRGDYLSVAPAGPQTPGTGGSSSSGPDGSMPSMRS